MSNKKQTAIEWLFDNLNLCFDKFDNGEYSYTEFVNASNEIKDQAKAMEKEHIMDAINFGQNNHTLSLPTDNENAEQYYKENYEQ